MLVLLLACSETGLQKGGLPDAAGAEAVCPAYSGFHDVGQTWTWALDNGETQNTSTYTLTAIDGEDLTLVMDAVSTGTEFSGTWRRESAWRCDAAGAWLVEETSTTHQEVSGAYPYTLDDVTTFAYAPQGWLIVPAGLDSGSAWDVSFTLTAESETWGASTQEWQGAYFAENEEEVEVAAGTFTVMEINGAGTTADDPPASWTDHDYRDADVGLVLDDTTAELAGWTE